MKCQKINWPSYSVYLFFLEERRSFSKLSKDASNVTDKMKAKKNEMVIAPKQVINWTKSV